MAIQPDGFNVDEYGVILSNEGSNGDSAHHTMFYQCLAFILGIPYRESIDDFFTAVKKPDGTSVLGARRHPTRGTDDFSRDQLTPFLAYGAITNDAENPRWSYPENKYFRQVQQNWYRFFNKEESDGTPKPWWNRDILDPATVGLFYRAWAAENNWQVYLGDLHILLSIITRFRKVKNDPSSTADENLQIHLIAAKLRRPTFISDFAWKYYFKNRPFGWRHAVKDFWDRDGKYLPAMTDLVIRVVEKLDPKLKQ